MPIYSMAASDKSFSTRIRSLVKSEDFLALAILIAASLLWGLSLPQVDVRNIDHLGIVSAFTPMSLLGMGLMNVGFVLLVQREHSPDWLKLAYVLVLIVMLYGITALIEEYPRFSVNYFHVGFAEHISRTGELATGFDARFSWPGFFAFTAFLMDIAKLDVLDTFPILMWSHVLFNILYLVPVWMISVALTENRRQAWFATWFFFLTNWIGQDYFSPQGMAFLFYLVIAAILIRWFKGWDVPFETQVERIQNASQGWYPRLRSLADFVFRTRWTRWIAKVFISPDPPNEASTPSQRAGLMFFIVLLLAAMVSSHQLTPFFTLATLVGWVVFNRIKRMYYLPILLAVMIGAWISFMTVDFLAGNVQGLLGDIGHVQEAIAPSTSQSAITVSMERTLIIRSRLFMSAMIWGLAGLSALWRLYKKQRIDWTVLIAAGAPFPMAILQSYGGEMLLRVYMFALPFMAIMIAYWFPFKAPRLSRLLSVIMIVFLTLNLGLFLLARHGNEEMDYVTREEFEGFEYLYSIAPLGSAMISVQESMPYRYRYEVDYIYGPYEELFNTPELLRGLAKQIEDEYGVISFVLVTRSATVTAELLYGMPEDWGEAFAQAIHNRDDFVVLWENRDMQISVMDDSLYWTVFADAPHEDAPTQDGSE